jgi:hypothetical protein
MNSFIQRHQDRISGVLSGWDRLRFRGTLRAIAYTTGLNYFLQAAGVLLKHFDGYAKELTYSLRTATEAHARTLGRPVVYLDSPKINKEQEALAIARRDGITQGLIAVLSATEPCWSFDVVSNRARHLLQLKTRERKCLHYYHYFLDPDMGLCHARVQTWLPVTIQVCLNGREWLARQMDREGLGYVQRDNCFVAVADPVRAQQLLDQQVQFNWSAWLQGLVPQVQPAHATLFGHRALDYYWSADETEWASDVLFHKPDDLARLYRSLVRHGIENLSSHDALRFLGRLCPERCTAVQVTTTRRQRPEGVCVKFRVDGNGLKMYDKQESVLRPEVTINNPTVFKSYRTAEGDPDGTPAWRPLRKGVADMPRRAEVSQAITERLLESLATVAETTPLAELAESVCQPVRRWHGRRARALNPLATDDASLLQAVSHGEFLINGFRNRDLRALLYGAQPPDPADARRQSAAVTRKLRLLRAHGLIHKVSHTHRYLVSPKGRTVITALLSARQADTTQLINAA